MGATFIQPVRPQLPKPERSRAKPMRGGMALSLVIHASVIGALVWWKSLAPPVRPPQYRIELIGAAGLKRAAGVVADPPKVEAPEPKPVEAPKAAERPPEVVKKVEPVKPKAKPEPKPAKATPNPAKATPTAAKDAPKTEAKAAPPVAGSGQTKTKGTDVANVKVDGIQFPFPWYLDNITRQIFLKWDWKAGGAWVTEFRFVIHKDGSVTDIQLLKSSGNRSFDLEGRGAIEAAGNARAFGPLPPGFDGETLPVYYSFTPQPN
ncbi:MAG: TonB family protein [Gemmatimonas sp.]